MKGLAIAIIWALALCFACGGAGVTAERSIKTPDWTAARIVIDVKGEPSTRDMEALASRFWFDGDPAPRAYERDESCCAAGDEWIFNISRGGIPKLTSADILHVSDSAYWAAERGVSVSLRDIAAAAERFENAIRPALIDALGDMWSPGVDGDERIFIAHLPLSSTADARFGIFDECARTTHPYSNEAEMLYIGARPGSSAYDRLLAGAFARGAMWNIDEGEEYWASVAISDAALAAAGYGSSFDAKYDHRRPISYQGGDGAARVGGALFARHMADACRGLSALSREPADGFLGYERYLRGCGLSLENVFMDFLESQILENGWDALDADIVVDGDYAEYIELPQSGARVYEIRAEGGFWIDISHDEIISVAPEDCEGCWWSGSADVIHSYMERMIDLSGEPPYELEFRSWTAMEPGYDYGYVSASIDGASWDLLGGAGADVLNPFGAALGEGYTGVDEGWTEERIDLSPYAGERVRLRFEHVTDEGLSLGGWLVDDISVSGDVLAREFEPAGFRRADGVRLRLLARLIERGEEGVERASAPVIERSGDGVRLRFEGARGHAALIVAPLSYESVRDAGYSMRFGFDE